MDHVETNKTKKGKVNIVDLKKEGVAKVNVNNSEAKFKIYLDER